jgi:hypothetical protein
LVRQIKASPAYTDVIGNELGIIGTEDTTDFSELKPSLKIQSIGGEVVVSFKKNKTDGVRIYNRRGSEAAFTFLASDTESPYVDNRSKLNPLQPAKREYFAYYIIKDDQIGQQSDIAEFTLS